MLCRYKREGKVSGHWCNECPPMHDYIKIEKKENQEFAKANKERARSKNGR